MWTEGYKIMHLVESVGRERFSLSHNIGIWGHPTKPKGRGNKFFKCLKVWLEMDLSRCLVFSWDGLGWVAPPARPPATIRHKHQWKPASPQCIATCIYLAPCQRLLFFKCRQNCPILVWLQPIIITGIKPKRLAFGFQFPICLQFPSIVKWLKLTSQQLNDIGKLKIASISLWLFFFCFMFNGLVREEMTCCTFKRG